MAEAGEKKEEKSETGIEKKRNFHDNMLKKEYQKEKEISGGGEKGNGYHRI